MKTKLLLVFLLAFSLLLVISYAFIITNSYKIRGVISGGGLATQDSSYKSKIVVGQPVIGVTAGTNYKVCFGFLCTGALDPPYSINLTGTLYYIDGGAVANTDIRIEIYYQENKVGERIDVTDGLGQFDIEVVNLPEYLFEPVHEDLDIKIYVYGDVDAIHECRYDGTTEKCT